MLILLEKPDEEKCSYTLITIGKWMIFDYEVEEMRCLFFDSWIEIYTIECCNDIGENSYETLILLISEDVICFVLYDKCIFEFIDSRFCFAITDEIGNILTSCF
jgi:hypothetical protein